jgi:hypothetical protein
MVSFLGYLICFTIIDDFEFLLLKEKHEQNKNRVAEVLTSALPFYKNQRARIKLSFLETRLSLLWSQLQRNAQQSAGDLKINVTLFKETWSIALLNNLLATRQNLVNPSSRNASQ